MIWEKNFSQNRNNLFVASANYLAWRERVHSADMAAIQDVKVSLTGGPNGHFDPEELKGERVSSGLFPLPLLPLPSLPV